MLSRLPRSARFDRHLDPHTLCASCLRRLSRNRPAPRLGIRCASTAAVPKDVFARQYFWGNSLWAKGDSSSVEPRRYSQSGQVAAAASAAAAGLSTARVKGTDTTRDTSTAASLDDTHLAHQRVLPHRRRRQRRESAQEQQNQTEDAANEKALPPDASSQLSSLASSSRTNSLRQRFYTYLSLSKPRLTALIVLTTTASYSLYPVAITPLAAHLTLSPLTLLTLTTGTALASASANAFNMLMEPQHDAKMSRTKTRPIVRGLVTRQAALVFAVIVGASGTALLWYGVNPTTAGLGALNIFLYAGVYTPLKRLSVLNTWAGALVGGIPPLMGWTAAAGQASPYADPTWQELLFAADGTSAGGWLLASLLFAWQFPHFWALAYPIRQEYAAAGYRMLVGTNVRMAGRSALRYSLAMFPICAGLSAAGVTGWWFVGASAGVNAWMAREAWRFWRFEGMKGSARGLFWASVWHLPITLVLAMVAKKGVWERVFWGGMDADELRMWQEQDDDGAAQQTDVSTGTAAREEKKEG